MSGLEKAIRNALSQSERDNADTRARIYHSARQALEAGLRKQDVTDPDVVNAQRQRLEAKIREIEFEERQRLAIERSQAPQVVETPPPPAELRAPPPANPAQARAPQAANAGPAPTAPRDEAAVLGGATRPADPRAANASASGAGDLGDLGVSRTGGRDQPAELRSRREIEAGRPPARKRWWQRRAKTVAQPARPVAKPATSRDARLDVAAGAEQRPRRRRRWISGLLMPLGVLAAAVWGVWWAGSNGMFVMPDLSNGQINLGGGQNNQGGPTGIEAGKGFSDDWIDVFVPKGTEGVTAGSDATVEAITTAGGPALKVTSRSTGNGGEIAIEVPPAVLREMAGKTSTVAITLQTAADRSVEVAVRCDFGSLGNCSRHRFQATQEKTDGLFHVSFDRSLAPNQAGHIYLNSDVLGGGLPINVFSARILPGQ